MRIVVDTTMPSSWIVIGSSTISSSGRRVVLPSGVTRVTMNRSIRLRATTVTLGAAGPAATIARHIDITVYIRGMEPTAVPPPPEPVLTDGPGDPTVGAGIADTRSVVRSLAPVAAAEFVGTAVLVMLGPGAAILAGDKIGNLGVALAFGFALLIMAYVIGPISGCHINPAITLGMWLARKVEPATGGVRLGRPSCSAGSSGRR